MIYIEKDILNTIVLTLTENSTLSNPYYIFKFENEFNTATEPIYFYSPDTSTSKPRYNKFELEEGEDLTLIIGQYKYEVFESATVPKLSLPNPVSGLHLVEEGRMVVDGVLTNSIYE
jgi:hypothetical protein